MHNQKFGWCFLLAVAGLMIGSVVRVEAVEYSYFMESSGAWTNATHWSLGTVPFNDTATYIGTTSDGAEPDATCSLDTDEQCYALYLGVGGGHIGRLNITDGSLDVTRNNSDWALQFGSHGTGIINQSGGVFDLLGQVNLRMGVYADGAGTLNLSGGAVTNVVNVKCGDVGRGTINLSSDGKMWVSTATYLGYTSGTGVVNQTGGTWDNGGGGISIAQAVGSSGEYNLSGGVLTNVGTLYVGNAGYGTFSFSSGAVLAPPAGATRVGDDATGTGVVTVTGGTWNNGNQNFELGYMAGGVGTLNLSGGSITNIDYLICPRAGHGTIDLSGTGFLGVSGTGAYLGYSGGTGVVNQTGGVWDNGGKSISFGHAAGSYGEYNISDGVLTNANALYVGKDGNGTVNLSDNGKICALGSATYVGNAANSTGVVNQTGGTWDNGGNNLALAQVDGAYGQYNISGGVLTNVFRLYVPAYGSTGVGVLSITGSVASICVQEYRGDTSGGTLRITPDSGGISPVNVTDNDKTWLHGTTLEVDFSNYDSTDDLIIINHGGIRTNVLGNYEFLDVAVMTPGWAVAVDYGTPYDSPGQVRLTVRPPSGTRFLFR